MGVRRYKYKAKDRNGLRVNGEVEAVSESVAVKLIRNKGLVIISLKAVSELPINFFASLKNRVTSADVASFTRQLATMVNAGLPITESLLILRSQSDDAMGRIISQVLADVEEGQSLSNSFARFEKVFSRSYLALVKSGETGGVLDKVLVRLADNMEREQEFKGKVRSALIYPVIIVIGMVLVTFVMMIFVVPRMTSLYDQFDAELPLATRVLIGISDVMVSYWPLMLAFFAIIMYAYKVYRKTDRGRLKTDSLLLRIPLVGELQKKVVLAELARTMSLMVGSGVSILESLSISSGISKNAVISLALKDASNMVEKGFPVALSFSKHPDAFPFLFTQMLSVGEETGKMDEVLEKVSHVFEVESNQKLKAVTAAVEPVILLILGVGVAFLVISIVMPIYNLTTQI